MQRSWSALLLVGATGLLAVPALADKAKDDKAKDDKKEKPPVVLHVGDSFVGSGFAQSLKPRFEAAGAKYISIAQTSGYTTTLPRQISLESLMQTHKPALVILTIGANEMAMPSPEDHAHAAKNLTRIISQSPCIWALPPRWSDKETGFRQVMRREAPPCRVHDAEEIADKIPRQADKIHPTAKGGQMWADHFWSWLMAGKPEGAKPWDEPKPAASASASAK